MPLGKIRAKVVFFRELRGICVKKSGDFWTNEAGQRAKRGKHFAILVVFSKNKFCDSCCFIWETFCDSCSFWRKTFCDNVKSCIFAQIFKGL